MPNSSISADSYLKHPSGVLSWLFTLDHKRIGLMYMVSILAAFLLGGVFAILIRVELMYPNKVPASQAAQTTLILREVFSKDAYNQIFTLHGAVMIFLFIIPGVPGALGNFVLPLMLGAKDVAFPAPQPAEPLATGGRGRASSSSAVERAASTPAGPSTPPTAPTTDAGRRSPLLGAFILGFSSILTGLNFIVTIHTLRAPDELVQHAAVPLGAFTPPPSSRCWPRRCWASRCCCWSSSASSGIGHLRPEARRRPRALPALLLVLLPPRRLHHDPARRWASSAN